MTIIMADPNTVVQEGMFRDTDTLINPLLPILGKIVGVNLRYSDEDTGGKQVPTFTTYDVETTYGVIRHVPMLRQNPREELRAEIGDRVVVGFLHGQIGGGFIMGFLDGANLPKSRTTNDLAYREDIAGGVTRIDENGSEIRRTPNGITVITVKKVTA